MKRVLTLLISLFMMLSLIGCTNINNSEYSLMKSERENRISELNSEIEKRKSSLEQIENEYSLVEDEYKEKMVDSDIEEIFKKANNYSTRANVKINATLYKQQFFFPVKEEKRTSSGFIFYLTSYYAYVLTTIDIFEGDFNQVSIKIEDAFLSSHTANIYKMSEEYGLAVLEFRLNTENDLYEMKIRTTSPINLETAYNIHSFEVGGSNHISISKALKESKLIEKENTFLFETDYVDNAVGSLVSDKSGYLIGIVSSVIRDDDKTYLLSYNNIYITNFLKSIGMISE